MKIYVSLTLITWCIWGVEKGTRRICEIIFIWYGFIGTFYILCLSALLEDVRSYTLWFITTEVFRPTSCQHAICCVTDYRLFHKCAHMAMSKMSCTLFSCLALQPLKTGSWCWRRITTLWQASSWLHVGGVQRFKWRWYRDSALSSTAF